jgi:hypothetical protein
MSYSEEERKIFLKTNGSISLQGSLDKYFKRQKNKEC